MTNWNFGHIESGKTDWSNDKGEKFWFYDSTAYVIFFCINAIISNNYDLQILLKYLNDQQVFGFYITFKQFSYFKYLLLFKYICQVLFETEW